MGSGGSKKKDQIVKQMDEEQNIDYQNEHLTNSRKVSDAKSTNSANQKGVAVSEETLNEYLDLEKKIKDLRNKKVLADFQVKVLQREHLEMDIIKAEANYKELEALTMKEAMDVANLKDIKQTLIEQGTYESKMSKETEEHIDALNKQEVQKKEIDNMLDIKKKLDEDIEVLSKEGDKLQEIVVRQDQLLHQIFDGEYGSEQENQLEKELITLEEQKNHIDQAFYRWKKAQTSCLQAVKQFSSALEDWRKLATLKDVSMDEKYNLCTKTRNCLIVALQNMQGAQRLLFNITFPYCGQGELDTLNKAITYIFTDMQTEDRHEHALKCYDTTFRRAAALHQWMTRVINKAIVCDLESATEAVKVKSQELKQERVSLIIKMIKERGGNVEYDAVSVADEELASSPETDLFVTDTTPDPKISTMPTPIDAEDLAPNPSKEDVYCQMEHLRKQHDRDRADFFTAQDKNLNTMKMKLQEKLNARRTRRSNSIMNAREVQFLKAK